MRQRAATGPHLFDQLVGEGTAHQMGRTILGVSVEGVGEALVEEQLERLEQTPLALLIRGVGADTRAEHERRMHLGQQRRMWLREGGTGPGEVRGRGDHGGPRQRTVTAMQVFHPDRGARHRDRGAADVVRHRHTAAEGDRDPRTGTQRSPVQARYRDEEVVARDVAGAGVVEGGETTAAEAGEDGLRDAAGQDHRAGGVRRVPAEAQHLESGGGGGRMTGGDAGRYAVRGGAGGHPAHASGKSPRG